MSQKTLKHLYLDQMKDLYSACKQAMPVVTDLGRAAHSRELAEALLAGNQGIARGIEVLADLCDAHGTDPTEEHCKGMEGLAAEARRHGVEASYADGEVHDAAIMAQYQRMTHYAMAAYGTLHLLADRLGLPAEAAQLKDCLEQTRGGDLRMTEITEDSLDSAAAGKG